MLLIAVFAINDKYNNQISDDRKPLFVALVIFAIGCSFGSNAGYAVNPARDFGPRLFTYAVGYKEVFKAAEEWFWIPIIAPTLGAIVGSFFYQLIAGFGL